MRLKPVSIGFALLFSFGVIAQDVPKADLFMGYSLFRFNPTNHTWEFNNVQGNFALSSFDAEGGVGSFSWNFNRHFAFESEFGAYTKSGVDIVSYDSTRFSYLFGPRFSVRRGRRFDPYFHVLLGGMQSWSSASLPYDQVYPTPLPSVTQPRWAGVFVRVNDSQNAFAMAVGGGFDIRLAHHFSLRPFQLDYVLTRFNGNDQNDFRYSGGVLFNFGGEHAAPPPDVPPPPPPAMKPCPGGTSVLVDQDCPNQNFSLSINATPSEVCPGALSQVVPAGSLPSGASMQWALNGEPISQAPALEFGSTGRDPGSYKVDLKVTAPGYNEESANTTVTVRPYSPPTGSLSASPAEIWVGEKANLETELPSRRLRRFVRSGHFLGAGRNYQRNAV